MPIFHKITDDLFEFIDVCDYAVNLVNTVGEVGNGLGLEFRRRVPNFVDEYKAFCRTQELRIGSPCLIEKTSQPWSMILMATREHYANPSTEEDIAFNLHALREMLLKEKYRYASIAFPVPFLSGLNDNDETILGMMQDYLGNLEATIILARSTKRESRKFRYLTIAGPLDYGRTEEEQQTINRVVDKIMTGWGTSLHDYAGIVSGGYPGVDAYVCGEHFGKNESSTYVYKQTDKQPLVIKPNSHRNGIGANLHLSNLLCEIGDDVILIKPKGHNNNRLSSMQMWLQSDMDKKEQAGLYPKRMKIFGDAGLEQTPEDVLIPQVDD